MSAVVPACPRCGYDLAGLIAAWKNECPMEAVCSECGLTFDCGRTLSPRLLGPRWSYEHGFTPSASRWWRTSFIALRPLRMFRELAVDHRVHPARLIRFALKWLLIFHLAAGISCAVSNVIYRWSSPYPGAANFLEPSFWWFTLRRMLLPYHLPLEFPVGPGSSMSVFPFPLYVGAFVPTLLMPAWLLLLGTSLRAAHVRHVHLVRGVAYAIPCAVVYIAVCLTAIAAPPMVRRFTTIGIPQAVLIAAMLLCFVHHLGWWYLFVSKYLRLRHGAAVVLLNTIMSILILMIAIALIAAWGVRF